MSDFRAVVLEFFPSMEAPGATDFLGILEKLEAARNTSFQHTQPIEQMIAALTLLRDLHHSSVAASLHLIGQLDADIERLNQMKGQNHE